jgi:hypothetical protein
MPVVYINHFNKPVPLGGFKFGFSAVFCQMDRALSSDFFVPTLHLSSQWAQEYHAGPQLDKVR